MSKVDDVKGRKNSDPSTKISRFSIVRPFGRPFLVIYTWKDTRIYNKSSSLCEIPNLSLPFVSKPLIEILTTGIFG